MPVSLDGHSLTLSSAVEVAELGTPVHLSRSSLARMNRFRSILEQKLSRGQVVYGVNTGFGSLSNKAIRLGNLKELQLNLIRSHAAGVGDPMPLEVVRAAMLIRVNSLLNGNSAVRTDIARMMANMLNEGVVPYVPRFGSLGACLAGDSLVYTNPSGPKQISEVEPGDTVYSFAGDLGKVRVVDRTGDQNNFRYVFEGALQRNKILRKIDSGVKQTYKLQTYTRELVCTDNHPFLKLSINRKAKGERADYQLEWTEMKQLRPGDLILALKKLNEEGVPHQIGLPSLRETTPDFMRLVGMVVGDGYVRRDLRGIYIALPPGKERDEYSTLIERLLGKSPGKSKDCIIIYNRAINRVFVSWGLAKLARQKRVPAWVFSLPIDQRLAFLEGYLDADATIQEGVRKHKDGHWWHQNSTTFESPNESLIREIRVLAISCGMRCGKLRSRERVRGLWLNGKHVYKYNTPTRTYEFTVMRRGFFPYAFNGRVNIDIDNPNFYFDRIVSINPHKIQHVFDIEVEGSHNFVSEGLVVHNSGDLVPSAHMALAMVAEGKSYYRGKLMESRTALAASRLKPVVLQAKEGLSLINGTCFTSALGCLATKRGKYLLEAGNSTTAVTAEVVGACSQSFDERLIGVKLHTGQAQVARKLRALLKGSLRVRSEPVPQDPYSIRCVPQVHGSVKDALDFAEKITVAEMNSVSDNP
ncbi:MAG TPA: aromatic amino acid lyase, partial [Nitrososphaerales archaeon]|nr:aromatic amino acid lyase [Nitrososphaerales archaeon]